MADTRTRPGVDRKPLLAYLRVQRDAEREIIAVLSRTSQRIDRELTFLTRKPGIGAAVRREQLILSQVAIKRELSVLWTSIGRTVSAGRQEAAAAAIESMFPPTLLRSVMPAADVEDLMRSAKAAASRGIETVQARLQISKIPLAESVYKNQQLTTGKIDAIVNEALARGASARELAADVRRFVRPDVKGGVRYAAMRLGRTELNNAFHATQVQSAVKAPWVTGVRWNLSGSHPEPDECNEYADEDHDGLGEGIWVPENTPPKPHPNCLCFCTPETVTREKFIDQYTAGEYDTIVDEIMRNGSVTFL